MGTYQVQDYIIYICILYAILWLFLRYFFNRINFDRKFIISVIPYIPLGIFIRLAADVGIFEWNQLWNVTPGVYILCVSIFVISFFIGLGLKRISKINPHYVASFTGIIFLAYVSYLLIPKIIYPERILFPILLTSTLLFFMYLLFSLVPRFSIFQRIENMAIIFAHILDGSATFIAYNYFDFSEEHILPNILIGIAGNNAIIMIPLKLTVVLIVIYILEKYEKEDKENKKLYRILKFIIFVMGIGPGLRNSILPSLYLG
ncbi:MAG TPA: DUF63 family protein [Candidatus Altiarchaeales archaeon]|nr:DUF63 family protein [Candidatus Altiarchaeales archaeon]